MNENNSSNPSWFNLDLKLDRFNKRTFNRITKKITFPRDTLTSSIDNCSTWLDLTQHHTPCSAHTHRHPFLLFGNRRQKYWQIHIAWIAIAPFWPKRAWNVKWFNGDGCWHFDHKAQSSGQLLPCEKSDFYEKMCKLSHERQTLMLTLYIKHSTIARCAQCTLVTSHDAGCL